MANIEKFNGNWVITKSEGKYVSNSDSFTITALDPNTAEIAYSNEITETANLVDDVLKYSFEVPCVENSSGICRYDVQISIFSNDEGTYSCLYGVTILQDPEDVAVWGAEEEGTNDPDKRGKRRGDASRLGR